MYFKIKICNMVIGIEHREPYIAALCEDYLAPDGEREAFTVRVSEEAVAYEKARSAEPFTEGMYEATAIHRRLTEELCRRDILLIHSAAAAVDGQAFSFLARSGVGKSTHIRQWKEQFGERLKVVNGDKPYYMFSGEELMVFGSPWRGKEGWGENISVPVKAFCFLERGEKNCICRAKREEILPRLFRQVLLPREAKDQARFMGLVDRLLRTVPFYILHCNISREAAVIAYEGMREGEVKHEKKK